MKNQKGITLVALVVTIIVLLILAAVSLSLVAGSDGLLSKASNSVDRTIIGSAKEQVELKVAEWVSDFYEAKYVNNNLPTIDGEEGSAKVATAQDYVNYKFNTATDNKVSVGSYTLTIASNTITVSGNGLPAAITVDVGTNGTLTNWSK